MTSIVGLPVSTIVVNPLAAVVFTPAAHADPTPPAPVEQQKVTTQSGQTGCMVAPDGVSCTGKFANAPIHHGRPDITVRIPADGTGLQWNDSNMPSTGSYAAEYDVVLT